MPYTRSCYFSELGPTDFHLIFEPNSVPGGLNSTATNTPSQSVNVKAAVGGGVSGGIIGIFLLICFIFIYRRHKSKTDGERTQWPIIRTSTKQPLASESNRPINDTLVTQVIPPVTQTASVVSDRSTLLHTVCIG